MMSSNSWCGIFFVRCFALLFFFSSVCLLLGFINISIVVLSIPVVQLLVLLRVIRSYVFGISGYRTCRGRGGGDGGSSSSSHHFHRSNLVRRRRIRTTTVVDGFVGSLFYRTHHLNGGGDGGSPRRRRIQQACCSHILPHAQHLMLVVGTDTLNSAEDRTRR